MKKKLGLFKALKTTLIEAISGHSADEISGSIPMDSDQASKKDDGSEFLADFRTDRFSGGGLGMTGPTQYTAVYATNATTPTTPIATWGGADVAGVQQMEIPPPAPDKVAKVGVRPKDVVAELGRIPSHWSLEGLDTKIEMLEAKRALITFALENAASVDGEWGDGHDAGEIAGGQCEDCGMRAASRVLGLLAAIDSDHPDYRQEWKP